MTRHFLSGIVVLVAMVCCARAIYTSLGGRAHASTKPVPRTSTLQEFTEYHGDRALVATFTHAIRSDGSEVVIERHVDAKSNTVTGTLKKLSFADGRMVWLNPDNELKSSFNLGHVANIRMPRRDPRSGCRLGLDGETPETAVPVFSEDVVGKIAAVKATSQHGELNLTQWFSPLHGCEMIKQVVVFEKSGGVSQQDVLSVSVGEPDPSLFEIPATAIEAKPSAMMAGKACKTVGKSKATVEGPTQIADPALERLYAQKGMSQ